MTIDNELNSLHTHQMPIVSKLPKHNQVTCYCKSRSFPHRLGSKDCNGAEWLSSYMIFDGEECTFCNHFNNHEGVKGCDAQTGAESLKGLPCTDAMLDGHIIERYPMTEIELFNHEQEKEQDRYGYSD